MAAIDRERLSHAGAQEVVDVEDADGLALVDHEQGRDAGRVQHFQSGRNQHAWRDDFGLARHDVGGARREQAGAHVTPQVAVGDNASELALAVDHAEAPERFLRHGDQRRAHGRVLTHQRQLLAPVHHVGNELESRTQGAAGVKHLEVVRGKPFVLQQRDRQTIADGELHGGGGGGRQAVRTRFLGARQLQHHIGLLGQCRVATRGYGDQRHLEPARIGEDVAELHALARPRCGNDGVLARDHAEIAVARLTGMHKEGWRARRGEGGRHFLANQPAFADAGDNHAAFGGSKSCYGLTKGRAQLVLECGPQRLQAFGLEVECAHG